MLDTLLVLVITRQLKRDSRHTGRQFFIYNKILKFSVIKLIKYIAFKRLLEEYGLLVKVDVLLCKLILTSLFH